METALPVKTAILHAERSFGPAAMGIRFTSSGILQLTGCPTEWGRRASGYTSRVVSSFAASGIRNALAFGLDTALRQDPRYFLGFHLAANVSAGFWPDIRRKILRRKT